MKVIFLDIDNTLLDFDEYTKRTLKKGFEVFSLGKFDNHVLDVFHHENDILWNRIEQGSLTFDELKKIRFSIIFSKLGIQFDGIRFETFYRDELHESAIFENGALDMVEYLKKKYVLAVSSNGPYEQQLHRLSICGLDKYFSYFFISEDIGYSKPDTRFFLESFRILNEGRSEKILPQETLILGDSLTSDMKGGHDFGMHTCFYKKKGTQKVPQYIDYTIDCLSQIKNFL